MKIEEVVQWMLSRLEKDGCLYQDDVVDYLDKNNLNQYLRENADGNMVLGKELLAKFLIPTRDNVVWVRSDFYWRYRVAEDEPGRNASG